MKFTTSPARLAALAATMAVISFPAFAADGTTDTTSATAPTYIDITINRVDESTGLEMGTNARARGTGSIATGTNSVAIGKNAVATGGNENRDTLTQKLKENKEKLDEIETARKNVDSLTDDLQSIRAKYADVIEAGTRVKQIQEAKEKARQDWQTKLNDYNTAVANSQQYINDAQAKINDLNSRLDGVSKLGSVDISSDAGLTTAATQLKSIVESGTSLNLSEDFYKDYVKSYYQALGDVRQNQIIYNSTSSDAFSNDTHKNECVDNAINSYSGLQYLSNWRQTGNPIEKGISYRYRIMQMGDDSSIDTNIFSDDSTITDLPSQNLVFKNIDTDVSTLSELQAAEANIPKFKAGFKTYFTNTNDRFMTDEVRTALLNQLDTKLDAWGKAYEVTYYQGQYEATKDTTWLDKKKKALDEYRALVTKFDNLPDAYTLRNNAIYAWKEANITDIQNKNKVTTDTLNSELEKALNISKDDIAKKQQELENLKKTADQAKTNYDAINPDQKDLYLSEQYDAVMKQLTDKATELKASQDKLDALKASLTLNDLTNIGENAYALGTDALATGTNAYAIGTSAIATGDSSLALGNGAIATGVQALAIGTGATVFGDHSGAIGDPNTVYGNDSYTLGNDNTIGAIDAATKKPLTDKGTGTFVIGNSNTTTANHAFILGSNTAVAGNTDYAIVLGNNAVANNGTGTSDTTTADDVIVIGHNASASLDNKANGSRGDSTSASTIAHSIAIGANAVTGEENAVALGFTSKANALNATAVGPSAFASAANAIALGYGSVGNTANVLSLGHSKGDLRSDGTAYADTLNRKITHVDAGFISATSTDAVNGSQLYATNTQITNLANAIKNLPTDGSSSGKANRDLDDLSDKGKAAIKDVMKDDMAQKANVDASNLSGDAVTKWQKALGTGEINESSTGLVTGQTVYQALKDMPGGDNTVKYDASTKTITVDANKDATTVDFSGKDSDGKTINRTITGVMTDTNDVTSAANVGYVQDVAGELTNGIQRVANQLTHDINKVGAGAAALAGLHPGDFDPENKLDFAAGYGHYKGANAGALGAYYHPNEDTIVSLAGTMGNGDPMLSAGVTFKIGQSGPNTMSRTALTKELNDVKAQNKALADVVTAVNAKNDQLQSEVEALKAQVKVLLAKQDSGRS